MTIEGVRPLGTLEYTTVTESLFGNAHYWATFGLFGDFVFHFEKHFLQGILFMCVTIFLMGYESTSVVKQFKKGNQ